MKTAAAAGEVSVDGRPKLALCVLCGLPAAGKSTFARALTLRLRQERGWAVGVLSYDDVLPPALRDDAGTLPRVSTGRGRAGADPAEALGLCAVDGEPPWILTQQCLCRRGSLIESWFGRV